MRVLITGADGFIGKNLRLRLTERTKVEIMTFTRGDDMADLPLKLAGVDVVFHLAGINRSENERDFSLGNHDLTAAIAQAADQLAKTNDKAISIVYSSSTQAAIDNVYGTSKRAAEDALKTVSKNGRVNVHIFRLPNVFGKWCKPNYNSAVATFCHNIARKLPIRIHDPAAGLKLVYVDDVVDAFMAIMDGLQPPRDTEGFAVVSPIYETSVGEIAAQIEGFRDSRSSLVTDAVGNGLTRALYSTYVSYLPVEDFAYDLVMHTDPRGTFVEMLKTKDSGQFSYFTAHPGITRGGHYHNSKTEKFLVIKGTALFKFRNMITDETHQLTTSGDQAEIVETVPGWTHDVTNVGEQEMVVMLWANEIFDRERPDTYPCAL